MQVGILSCTPHPMQTISMAAGTCYGKREYSEKRVRACHDSGHMSVFEHASVAFRASGISRACSHQLVRHRLASFSQMSERYCRIDVDGSDWYVIPYAFVQGTAEDSLTTLKQARFRESMRRSAEAYLEALEIGIRPEDARYLLPEATKTEIVVTMNARELFHFLDLRLDGRAQWEIRELAHEVERKVAEIDGEWAEIIGMRKNG